MQQEIQLAVQWGFLPRQVAAGKHGLYSAAVVPPAQTGIQLFAEKLSHSEPKHGATKHDSLGDSSET